MSILQVGRQLFGAEYFWQANASYVRSGLPEGHSDFAGTAHGPIPVYVEAKSLGNPKLRPKQVAFLDLMEKRGCFCCVAFDEDPGQLARAWRVFYGGPHIGAPKYSWRANHEANLAEAKRVVKGRKR